MKKRVIFIFIFLLIVLIFILYFYFFYNSGSLKVSLTFDDGYISHYKKALPLLEKYNFTATEFIIANRVDGEFEDRKLMNLTQLKELEKARWEVASHSFDHFDLTKISLDEAEERIRESREKLQKEGFNVTGFAYPYGKYNSEIMEIVKKYYSYSRAITIGFNYLNKSRHNLKSFTPNKRFLGIISVKNLCSLIKLNKNKDVWMIITLHDINEDKIKKSHDINQEELGYLLKCLQENGVRVKNINDVLEVKE